MKCFILQSNNFLQADKILQSNTVIKKTYIHRAMYTLIQKGFRLPVRLTPQQEAKEICI